MRPDKIDRPEIQMNKAFRAFLWAIRRLPAYWRWRLYRKFSGDDLSSESGSGAQKTVEIQPHGYTMVLMQDDWMERYAARMHYYYDADSIAALQVLLAEGDTFIVVGANIGFLTLSAAALVGPQGRVFSFEPNPALAKRLNATITANGIQTIEVHSCALGAEKGERQLKLCEHHGQSHVTHPSEQADDLISTATVRLKRADTFLNSEIISQRLVAKIDVEGFEMDVLEGMGALLNTQDAALLIEVTDTMLRKYGQSSKALFGFLEDLGFAAFLVRVRPFSGKRVCRLAGPLGGAQYYTVFAKGDFAKKLDSMCKVKTLHKLQCD